MEHLELAILFLKLAVGAIAILFILLISLRAKDIIYTNLKAHYLKKYSDYLLYVQSNLVSSSPLFKPYFKLTKFGTRVLEEKLITLIMLTHGESKSRLILLCRQLGMVDFEMKRLSSISSLVKVDAAYNLGVLQAGEAIPKLLKLLDRKKYRALSFVVAGSIVSCTEHREDIIKTVGKLLMGTTGAHNLIAEIIESNSNIKVEDVFIEMLNSHNADMVKIALAGLQGSVDQRMGSRLRQLTNSEEKEIRIKAVKTLISSGSYHSSKEIAGLFNHEDWEIRASIVKTIGLLGLVEHIEILREGLSDEAWWVRYNSSRSLALLKQQGFKVLCESALQNGDRNISEIA